MANEFEPYDKQAKVSEFNVWEYKISNDQVSPEESQEQLISELETLKQQAYQEGYANGMQQSQQDIDQIKSELYRWIELLQNPIQIIDEQLTQEIIKTIILLCQQSIGIELSIQPEKLHSLLDKIKKELPSLQNQKVLKMNPDDVEWVKSNLPAKMIDGLHDILDADPQLNRGDFYLQGSHSELDGRLETRLTTLFEQYIVSENLQQDSTSGKNENE